MENQPPKNPIQASKIRDPKQPLSMYKDTMTPSMSQTVLKIREKLNSVGRNQKTLSQSHSSKKRTERNTIEMSKESSRLNPPKKPRI